jgi:hypothetical protein
MELVKNSSILLLIAFHAGKTRNLSFIGVKVNVNGQNTNKVYTTGQLTIQINLHPAAVRSSSERRE